MANEKLKKLPATSLYIVEDHNDVVPFIHRGIGSKHLPLNDIVFVHFDSHPDLLIPSDLKADDVFKKDILYEKISIENWILPLVYAGHISCIVWFKPPWCDQIKDNQIQFYVGKCSSTGYIRATCKENYFISEALYSSADKLENKKEVVLHIITIEPKDWKNLSDISVNNQTLEKKTDLELNCNTPGDTLNKNKRSCDVDDTDRDLELTCNTTGDTLYKNKRSCDVDDTDQVVERNYCDEKSKKRRLENNASCDITTDDIVSEDSSSISKTLTINLQNLYKFFKDKHFILDIDLDFFSTQNPFKRLYSAEIYNIIKELYVFTKPKDINDEAIAKCNTKREEQLSQLKEIFNKLHHDTSAEFEHPRKDLILRLRDAVIGTDGMPDFLLVHDAGCTCDDTELPDHVSTKGEIIQLISAVQESLSHFHKPAMITMARSSITDGYCPPHQVDSIQDQTLDMLQDLYLEINVTQDYQDSS